MFILEINMDAISYTAARAKSLIESIAELESGKGTERDLIE